MENTDFYMPTEQPVEEVYIDTSEKILALSDRLAEEIILENITDQLEEDLDTLNLRINYVSLFKEKYEDITPDDECYDEGYMKESLGRVALCLGEGLKKRYGVELGEDLDFATPAQYLTDMETLYQFLFIRHYENLVDYFKYMLLKNKNRFIESYSTLMEEEEHSKDLFVVQSKKKFKNKDDVLIMHFLNEIMHDIISETTSTYDLFKTIANLDIYEEYNNRMSELLIDYGAKIVLNNDSHSAKLYLKPLEKASTFSEIRNAVLISYLEQCEVDD